PTWCRTINHAHKEKMTQLKQTAQDVENRTMIRKVLTTVALVLVAALPATSPGTGIPVLDVSNLVQNTTTALKQVQTYAQMVQSYQLQLQGIDIEGLMFWRYSARISAIRAG